MDRRDIVLWRRQLGRCAITGEPLDRSRKIDRHHKLANKGFNRRLYPHFIDSAWNVCLVKHGGHLNKPKPKAPPYHVAARAEAILKAFPGLDLREDLETALERTIV